MRKRHYLFIFAFFAILFTLVGVLTYRKLSARYLQRPSQDTSQKPVTPKSAGIPPKMPEKYSDLVIIKGSISKDDSLQLDTFTVLPKGRVDLPDAGSEYSLQEKDSEGNIVFEAHFNAAFRLCVSITGKFVGGTTCEDVNEFPIRMIVPYPEKVALFVFKHKEKILNSIRIDGRLPGINVLFPEDGSRLKDTVAIRWEGFDEDSKHLSYLVEYRRNHPKSSWLPLQKNGQSSSLTTISWDTSGLQSGSYSLKITARDNTNAAWVTLDNLSVAQVRKSLLPTFIQKLLEKLRF